MSENHAGHDHTHSMAKQTLRLAFFLSLLIVAAEVGGGLLAHSLAHLSAKAAHLSPAEIWVSAAGVLFLFNLVDWLLLDWLVICTMTPPFIVLPGTEGMAGYKNYGMHFKGFLIGTVLSVIVGGIALVIAVLL